MLRLTVPHPDPLPHGERGTSTSSRERLPGLDLLRAIAITWVMLFHAQILGVGTPWKPLTRHGWMGVDLFFVLSGFLIARQWLRGPLSFPKFYGRRAQRILPAFLVTLALYFLVPPLREKPNLQPLWQYLTFTENFFFDFPRPTAFTHVWSLCVEEHFYLLFPLISWLLLKRPSARVVISLCLALLVFGIAWRGYQWFTFVEDAGEDAWRPYYTRIYYPTTSRLDGLLAGVVLAVIEVKRQAWWQRLTARPLISFTVGAILLTSALIICDDPELALPSMIGFPLVALAMAAFLVWAVSVKEWPRMPGIGWLAAASYSLYLTHKMTMHLANEWAEDEFIRFFVATALVLIGGALLHQLVEKPLLQLRRVHD